MGNEKEKLIKTLVFRPGEEPVFEMIPATQEAFEQLLDNGWVQHTQLGTHLIWILRNKYAEEDGLPYNRTYIDLETKASVDLYGTFAVVGIAPDQSCLESINEETGKDFISRFKKH